MIPLLNFHPDHAPCVLKRLLLTTVAKFCHVRKSGVFTHGKNSHEGGRIETSLCPLVRPAGVEPLEVRFAHPVRLSPDTHSQGHGRPCLQRLHPAGLFCHVFFFCDPFRCHFLILVDSDWSLSLKLVYSGCSFFGSIFRGSFCIEKTF